MDSTIETMDREATDAEVAANENNSHLDDVIKDVEEALHRWSEEIIKLGAHPKGYFTVDFQSVDPEMLYCWNYGEDRISFTHKVWENFNHRRPLGDDLRLAIEYSKEVN